jgi:hypothetical protein
VIDAVYSIGARYESTYRTVCDFCSKYEWEKDRAKAKERTVREFLELLNPYESRWQDMAVEVFRNRQRTSTRSGILKAEAVYRFAKALHRAGIDTLSHLSGPKLKDLSGARADISAIPGQASGLSFSYFLMLAGRTDVVKPDRMLTRYVACALGRRTLDFGECEQLVLAACSVLQSDFPHLTPTVLDFRIWEYQRQIEPGDGGRSQTTN